MGALNHIPPLAIPPQQQDPIDQYSKLISIQRLKSGQQLQQQQVENAQLQNQEKTIQVVQAQRDQQDQQITNKAYIDSGGDPQKFMQLLPQYGASYKAALQAKAALAMQVKTLAESDDATFKAHKSANALLGEQAQEIMNAPPEDQAALYTLKLNQIKRDPQLSKYAQGFPQQYPGPDGMKSAAIGLGMNDALIKQAEEQRKEKLGVPQQQTAEAEATIKGAEAEAVKKGGAIPGVPLDVQAVNAWLARPENKGKDIAAARLATTPSAIILNNQLGGTALDQAAERYSQMGELPQGFSRSPGTTAAIIQRAAVLHPDQSIAANKATFGADSASLKKLQTIFDQVSAFENTAGKNLDLFLDKLNQIPDLGVKFANVPMRLINDKMIGTANYQAMKAAQQVAAAETAKVLGSANASGVLSDSQKKEAEDMLSGNLSYSAAKSVVATLKQDFGNRHVSYQNDINAIKQRLNPQGQQPPATQSAPAAAQHVAGGQAEGLPDGKTGKGSDGKPYIVKGGIWVPAQ